jgi:hypothetical protein
VPGEHLFLGLTALLKGSAFYIGNTVPFGTMLKSFLSFRDMIMIVYMMSCRLLGLRVQTGQFLVFLDVAVYLPATVAGSDVPYPVTIWQPFWNSTLPQACGIGKGRVCPK